MKRSVSGGSYWNVANSHLRTVGDQQVEAKGARKFLGGGQKEKTDEPGNRTRNLQEPIA